MSSRAKNLLIVAFHFPPIAAAGTHRTLNFTRRLAARGWGVGVLSTRRIAGQAEDKALLERVPEGVLVSRAGHLDPFLLAARLKTGRKAGGAPVVQAMPMDDVIGAGARLGPLATARDYLSRLFMIPDRYASWIAPAVARGVLLGRRVGAGVIFSTAPPFSAHLAGLLISKVLDIPWIVDLRDPWTLNPFHANPYPSQRRIDAALERTVFKNARCVILNTVEAERAYRARYADFGRFLTINNGIDPDLLGRAPVPVESNGRATLLHVGAIYGRRYPAGLITALARLREQDSGLYERIRVELVGPVDPIERLNDDVRRLGLASCLVLSGSVAHQEAFRRSRTAHGLLLLGPTGREPEVQVPSKLFEYLAAGRPILALARPGGAIATVLEQAAVPCVVADPNDPDAIAAGLRRFAGGGLEVGNAASRAIELFGYEHLASLLETELDRARGVSPSPAGAHEGGAPDA